MIELKLPPLLLQVIYPCEVHLLLEARDVSEPPMRLWRCPPPGGRLSGTGLRSAFPVSPAPLLKASQVKEFAFQSGPVTAAHGVAAATEGAEGP